MLIISMGLSVDGYINDRDGNFAWGAPNDDLFRFHLQEVGKLGAYLLGRRLFETMQVWETDPSLGETSDDHAAFAAVWAALPKVVFSRTLQDVEGNARLATGSVAEELADLGTDRPVEIGGADLAAQAVEAGLVDEFRMFRSPIIVGGGTPYLPPVTDPIPLTLGETRTFGDVIYERYTRA